ncbi:YrhK family protein [Jannaschia seohaensis]|uniref:YrhK-like protein n=1 Tax=Jannaschia seohaensis TaxID=475081 RepID=A0A2Y9A3F1_9RHOB|nr:YrhK family protein [Jannaschia seohaensis]PWJ22487.1 YrhK-like protein [Jannaschia seohaensis]SSA38765.1 YrhK-like protein [Jannaschia seohaensis]
MGLFRHENRQTNENSKAFYAACELLYTAIDFGAALCFLAGSVLFYWRTVETTAITLFVIGSVLFAAKPTISFLREVKLAAMGDEDRLADRLG